MDPVPRTPRGTPSTAPRQHDGGTYGVSANMSVNQREFSHNTLVPATCTSPLQTGRLCKR
ncbi:hypothethical protein [Ralstonia solanacearum PSI07]|nr:hypothethical protein [Ralstonia solanacearum PSI07]